MKKNLIKVFIVFCLLITITACGKKEDSKEFKLRVTASSWSGEGRMTPPEEEFTYDVELNKRYVVKEGSLGLVFTVTEINKDSITIKTEEPFSDNEEGINLRSNKKEFILEKDKKIKLNTPTMDAGGIYTLTLY